ncbi:MAG: hypothetical protein QOD00_1829 [Blastocatellia bacterium]|jgi:hypothetical protein|nr:hypothetical protein [Blastocatellia bacterium]
MRRLKKLVGIVLLLSVMGLGGTSVFADGSTEIPTRKINQSNPVDLGNPPVDGSTEIPCLTQAVSYLVMILPL